VILFNHLDIEICVLNLAYFTDLSSKLQPPYVASDMTIIDEKMTVVAIQ